MIIQKYNLNMIPDKVPVMVRVSQYDQFSRTIIFSLYDGATEYEIPSGSTISVRGTKPDHTGFEYPCTFEGNEVSFDIEPQQTVLSGLVPSEIRITSNNEIVGSCNFIINVEPTPLDESTVISDTELPLIEEASQAAVIAQGAAARAEEEADRAEQVLSTAVKSVNNELPDAQGNVDVVALPDGGTTGQILTKQSSTDGDADWENPLINYEITGSVPSATPLNADQLQGHPASYYQKLLTAGNGIDISNDVISSFSRIELVWSNSSPTTAFASQTVRTGLTNVKAFILFYRVSTNINEPVFSMFVQSNQGLLMTGIKYNAAPYYMFARKVIPNIAAGTLSFETAYPLTAYGTFGSADNSYAIPIEIYALY